MPGIVTVVTPAEGTALTTLEAVKAAFGLTTDDRDSRLETLINQASGKIADALFRVMGRRTVAETFRVSGLRLLILKHDPIAISGITVDGTALSTDAWEADMEAGLLFRLSTSGTRVPWYGTVVVTYTTGWILPGAVGRDLPDAIEAECIGIVRCAFEGDARDPNVISEGQEGVGQVRFADRGASGMTVDTVALARYVARL